MKVKEVKEVKSEFGADVESKAKPVKKEPKKAGVVMAQYPSNRAESLDADAAELNALYKNGLILTAFELKERSSNSLRDFRSKNKNTENPTFETGNKFTFNKESLANILMPRSQTDIDTISHKFNDVEDSLSSRADSIGTNMLSSMASTAVFGAIDSLTKGIMADNAEQLHTTARSMYQGAENRTKVFSWQLTPRNVHDLIEILRIYEIVSYLSYGKVGVSEFAKDVKAKIDSWYAETILSKVGLEDQKENSMVAGVTDFLTNAITVSNPTIWTIKNFGAGSKFDYREDVFGPAQITNIRFDKSSDGKFRGLSIAPNLPNTFMLEITFREILTLDRRDVGGEF